MLRCLLGMMLALTAAGCARVLPPRSVDGAPAGSAPAPRGASLRSSALLEEMLRVTDAMLACVGKGHDVACVGKLAELPALSLRLDANVGCLEDPGSTAQSVWVSNWCDVWDLEEIDTVRLAFQAFRDCAAREARPRHPGFCMGEHDDLVESGVWLFNTTCSEGMARKLPDSAWEVDGDTNCLFVRGLSAFDEAGYTLAVEFDTSATRARPTSMILELSAPSPG